MSRQTELAQIHIAKKDLGLDDDTYRSILLRIGGHTSSAKLDLSGRHKAIEEFKRLGWKPKRKCKRWSRKSQKAPADVAAAMWITLHRVGIVKDPSENALDKYCRRMIKIDHKGNRYPDGVTFGGLRMLDNASWQQQNALINALRGWIKRVIKAQLNNDIAAIITHQKSTGKETKAAALYLLDNGKIRYWHEFDEWLDITQQDHWKK